MLYIFIASSDYIFVYENWEGKLLKFSLNEKFILKHFSLFSSSPLSKIPIKSTTFFIEPEKRYYLMDKENKY